MIELVVNNTGSVKQQVIDNLKACNSPCSTLHAVRGIKDFHEANTALNELVVSGAVERSIVDYKGYAMIYFRWRHENHLYRRLALTPVKTLEKSPA